MRHSRILLPDGSYASTSVVIYCDEAGNTGPNYIDPNQPFFVLAAWAVPVASIAEASAQVEFVRKHVTQGTELKSSSILGSKRGKLGIIRLIRALGGIGCLPFFVLAEKRYCIAGKIVETFLDPLFNPKLREAFIPDTTTKQEFANTLYDKLTDEELNCFAEAYRKPTEAAFRGALDAVVSASRARVNAEMANLLDGCREQLADIATLEASQTTVGRFGETLNHPVLAGMFVTIELAARRGLINPVKFVHDENHHYEEGFRRCFDMLREPGEIKRAYPYGLMREMPMHELRKFETASSKSSPLIQAADVLAGAIRHCADLASRNVKPTDEDSQLVELTMGALLVDDPQIASLVASDKFILSLLSDFRNELPDVPEDARNRKLRIAPIIPPAPDKMPKPEGPKYQFKFPLFVLAECQTNRLYCITGLVQLTDRGGNAMALFESETDARAAVKELATRDPSANCEIRRFDDLQFNDFIFALKEAAQRTSTIFVQRSHGEPFFMDIGGLSDFVDRIEERAKRAKEAGILGELYVVQEIDGITVGSMLMSDGRYAAMQMPSGTTYSAATRDEAIALAVRASKD